MYVLSREGQDHPEDLLYFLDRKDALDAFAAHFTEQRTHFAVLYVWVLTPGQAGRIAEVAFHDHETHARLRAEGASAGDFIASLAWQVVAPMTAD